MSVTPGDGLTGFETTLNALDLSTAAYLKLVSFQPFLDLVDQGVIGTDLDGTPWLFQGLDNDGRPYRDPEGSGKTVVVLSERREWTSPNMHNTAYFPTLQMLIYTDSDRDADGNPILRNAPAKCKAIFRILDRCFHLPGNQPHDRKWLATYQVHRSTRGGPFGITDVPGTNEYVMRGEAVYNMITD